MIHHVEHQTVMVVTERAVFEIGPSGPVLTEIAPGVDLEQDVLAKMDFRPEISPEFREMAAGLFLPSEIGLAGRLK